MRLDICDAPLEQPLLYTDRSFIGYGQEPGGVQAILTNPSSTDSVNYGSSTLC
jgi:phosphatidylinositol glycan class T